MKEGRKNTRPRRPKRRQKYIEPTVTIVEISSQEALMAICKAGPGLCQALLGGGS